MGVRNKSPTRCQKQNVLIVIKDIPVLHIMIVRYDRDDPYSNRSVRVKHKRQEKDSKEGKKEKERN